MTVTELAELSKFSKAYISQVKNGKRPPSQKLLDVLEASCSRRCDKDYYSMFMQSRLAMQVSHTTVRLYRVKLGRFLSEVNPDTAQQHHIERFLLRFNNAGNRRGYFQVIRTFYIWRERIHGLDNPIKHMVAPKVGRLILPSLTKEQVKTLWAKSDNLRDKAIIALFTESGLRLTELTAIKPNDIDWQHRLIKR